MQAVSSFVVEPIGVVAEQLPRPIHWQEMFGNDHPVEFEIGMGKGTFITDQAKARPHVNFFGIEWANWFWRYASDRLRRNNCNNVRTIRAEAGFFLREFVPPHSLSVMHIYFPDPWPKARHNKRRLISQTTLALFYAKLKPGGVLRLATDHEDYSIWMLEQLLQFNRFIWTAKTHADWDFPPEDWVPTRYQAKAETEGRKAVFLEWIKQ